MLNRKTAIWAAARLSIPLVALCAIALAGEMVFAQTAPTSLESDEAKLEQDFTDPLSTLPQLIVRDSYTPANFGTHLETNQAIIRPLIPRIPPNSLLPIT